MGALAKASLVAIDGAAAAQPLNGEKPIDVQFNPATMHVTLAKAAEGRRSTAGQSEQAIGAGNATLTLDLHFDTADEGTTAQRILFTGTHTGSFRGLPPTGRKVRFAGLEINRMVDGKIAEHWFQLDAVTLFEQIGLRIVPGPRLLPRLIAAPVTRLLGKKRRSAGS